MPQFGSLCCDFDIELWIYQINNYIIIKYENEMEYSKGFKLNNYTRISIYNKGILTTGIYGPLNIQSSGII